MRATVRQTVCAFVLMPTWAFGAFERELLIPSSVALGGATVSHDAPLSANPAAQEDAPWASVAYTRPFRVEGLAEQSLRGGVPLREGRRAPLRLGVDFGRFGNDVYSEDVVSVSLRWRYRFLSFGGRTVYYRRSTEGFQSARAFSPDVGVQIEASPTMRVGASVRRLVASDVLPGREYRAGTRLRFLQKGLADEVGAIFLEVCRRGERTGVAVGGEWTLAPAVTGRVGVHSLPWQWAGGVEVRRDGFAVHYAVETHPALETTHVVGLTWRR